MMSISVLMADFFVPILRIATKTVLHNRLTFQSLAGIFLDAMDLAIQMDWHHSLFQMRKRFIQNLILSLLLQLH